MNKFLNMSDDTVLGCHCKPKACHGDVVINAVKYLKNRKLLFLWFLYKKGKED